jgi:hypothetical protein
LVSLALFLKKDFVMYQLKTLFVKLDHSERVLATFNNNPLEVSNEYLDMQSDSTVSILFLGNSITYCDVPDEEPDKTLRGLATSSKDKDYVHRLVDMVAKEKQVNVNYTLANICDFERGFLVHPFDMAAKLSKSDIQSPDILIVQIGENVHVEDLANPEIFKQEYVKLLNLYPHALRIIALPFWPNKEKQRVITEVALESHSYLVDLGHLGDGIDYDNFAKSVKKYKQPGVGAHPGDYGMENIAKCFFSVINAHE